MGLVYEENTKVLRRCLFDVQNEVGLGRHEEEYHQGCKLSFEETGIPFASKPPHPLLLDGEVAYVLYPDFVAWDSITVELKAVPRSFSQSEFVQIFDYLKCRGDRLGLLVNMGLDRVHVERVAYDPPDSTLEEDWEYWSGEIQGRDREVGVIARDALRAVFEAHGAGYGDEVLQHLITFALKRRHLRIAVAPVAKAYFHSVEVGESPLDCLVVEGRILLAFTALFDNNQFNINRGLSFLRALGLTWGIAANFGKNHAQFTALHSSS